MKYLAKVIEIGVYFFVFTLPVQTRWISNYSPINGGYLEYTGISIYASDLLLLFILSLSGIYFLMDKRDILRISSMKKIILISGLDLIIFVSIFFATDKIIASFRYFIFLLGVWLFYLINNKYFNFNKIKIVYSLLLGLTTQACLGIYQFITQSTFSSKYFGIAMHNPADLGVSVIQTLDSVGRGERWLRAYGGFDHPNIFGGAMAIGLLVAIGMMLSNFKGKSDKFDSYFLIVTYILMFAGLFFSFSRSAWLGFSIGLCFVLIWNIIEGWNNKTRKIVEITVLTCIMSFFLFFTYKNLVMTRIKGGVRLENKSKVERIEYMRYAKEIIDDNPICGVGIGNYSIKFSEIKSNEKSWFYQPVHNVFLLVLAEIGMFGLILFIGILLFFFQINFRKKNIINLSILFCFVIMMTFDHWLWSLHFGVLFFWTLMAMITKYDL